jgi:hypothetical protein
MDFLGDSDKCIFRPNFRLKSVCEGSLSEQIVQIMSRFSSVIPEFSPKFTLPRALFSLFQFQLTSWHQSMGAHLPMAARL